ncbi:MAG: hypothetical protein ACK53Y_04820, partial [bacterium]
MFRSKTLISQNDIYIDAVPISTPSCPSSTTVSSTTATDDTFCRAIQQFQDEVDTETKHIESLLSCLRQYYNTVKTKCQLGLEVPAGFRSSNSLQRDFHAFLPPCTSS